MGILDFNPDLNDPKTQLLVTMGLGLLGGNPRTNRNFGADMAYAGAQGLGAYGNARQFQVQQQAMERQNRASDLQTAMGAYNFLRAQELPKMLSQGANYTPPPELAQLESRISGLINEGNLSGAKSAQPAAPLPAPSASPMTASSAPAAATSASPSLVVRPEFRGSQGSQGAQPSQSPRLAKVGDPAGGLPMNAWLMQDPTGRGYFEQLAKDNALISSRYGIFQPRRDAQGNITTAIPIGGALPQGALPYQAGPNGEPTVGPLPGQLKTLAQLTATGSAAKEAGEFPFRTQNVTLGSGAVVPRFTSQVAGQPNLGPLSQILGGSIVPSSPQPPQQSPTIPPAVQAAAASGKPFEATQTPDGQVTVTDKSDDPFADIPKRYTPQGFGQTTFDREMASKEAESASTVAAKLGAQADAANQRIALNNQALKLVDQSDTGPKAALIGDVKNWLVSRVGIPESSFENTPSATIALQKDLLNAATQRAKQQFGSRITQSEVMLMLTRGSPNVDMTKASIKYLINGDNAMQGYQIKQANDFGTYLQRGGDPMRFESWYASKFPASDQLGKVQLKTEVPPSGSPKTVRFQDLP